MNYPTCKTCKHRGRKSDGILIADPRVCMFTKIGEDWGQMDETKDDCLKYSYTEGGSFDVGDNFGCIHHEVKT